MITGEPLARNTPEDPTTVVASTQEVNGLATSSRFSFPPYPVTLLRLTGAIS